MEELKIPDNVRKMIDRFVDNLKNIYGDGLISVTLYGSAASGEFAGRSSNINLAIVLNDASIRSLKKAGRLVTSGKFSLINPFFFTEEYIARSIDVFPIEFLDMKENHFILHGKDVFGSLQIDLKNLRFQCEQELKAKIINIKKMYLKTRGKSFLRDLLFKSATSSLHIMRNLIRLKGKIPSYKKEYIPDEISREFMVDCSGLKKILDAKSKKVRLNAEEIDGLFDQLVNTLESVTDKLDRL